MMLKSRLGVALTVIVAAGIGAAGGAFWGQWLSQRAFDSRVHSYLIAHPQVLMEMDSALRRQADQARDQAVVKHLAAIDHNPGDPVWGNPKGTVTIAEWFDYQCPFCKAEAPVLARLVKADPHVRVVEKMFPVIGGPGSVIAAKAALASMRQGKFVAFHAALLADHTPEDHLDEARIMAIAKSVGLDVARLKHDMAAPGIMARISANLTLAREIGITATPGLVIGDHLDVGFLPYARLKALVDEAEKAKPGAAQ